MGGAMDLVHGARRILVAMEHVTRKGEPRIMDNCTLPLTGRAVVHRIVTDLAVLDIEEDGLRIVELLAEKDINEVQNVTEATILPAVIVDQR
jgi:3-oxoacid CoA-transferase subunit B